MKKINFQVHINRIIAAILLLSILFWETDAIAIDKVNKDSFGVAIKGYDTVAYFTEGRAVKGKSEFSHSWNEATWHFASADNRDLFAADPDRYAPQYGGYWVGYLAKTGKVAGVNPEAWKIVNNKLYLSWDMEAAEKFQKNSDELIKKAYKNWLQLNR